MRPKSSIAGWPFVLRALLILPALVSFGGCASETVIRHDEPHSVDSCPTLSARAAWQPDGELRLFVFREYESKMVQDYWRERAGRPAGHASDPAMQDRHSQTASVGFSQEPSDGLAWLAIPIAAVYAALVMFSSIAKSVVAIVSFAVPVDDQRTTVVISRRLVQDFCDRVVVEAAGSFEHLDRDSWGGFVLSREAIARLGGPGATVTVRDGDLSTTLNLGLPR